MNGSEWLPHAEAVFRIDLGEVYPGVGVRSLTEWRNIPGGPVCKKWDALGILLQEVSPRGVQFAYDERSADVTNT
jgi:hypothetical protein